MNDYDVFIRDGREYGGGFEVRVGAPSEAKAKAEAIDAANAEGEATYDLSDVGSVRMVERPSADDMAGSDGLGLR